MDLSVDYRRRFWLFAIFVLSGLAGLIYQSIWSHYLGLFLGHAAYAQALVLAIFMGGMAAGAAWIAKAGQRWRNLIRGYALIEAAIGVFGLLFHWVFQGASTFSYDWLIPALGAPWAINLARWLMAAALILPQTILLGMTFPLMSGGLIRRFPGSDGHVLGGLYFSNSIGAAIGALVAVFVLLPAIGLPGAMATAGAINFLVAGLAWWLAREPEPKPVAEGAARTMPEQHVLRSPLLRMVLFGTALSGAASFGYEIIWVRMLSMAVGNTMHAFELMLASFIAGIALGGLWIRKRADLTSDPLRLAGWMQIFMGVAALASLVVYANAFSWVGWLMHTLTKTDGGYTLFNFGTATVSIFIMLPAAFFAGTTLPLFTVALLRQGHGERSIGRVYAWNTLGAIAGVFASIHLLIPVLGLKLALCVAALVDLAVGLVLLRLRSVDKRQFVGFTLAGALTAIALIVAVRVPYDPYTLASGVYRYGNTQIGKGSTMLFYRDGKTASISAFQASNGIVTISTNGKPDASISMTSSTKPTSDEPTMVLAAALPLTLSESPERVAVIGFGSGLTTHTLLADQRIKSVNTIEIEQAMVDGARSFGPRVQRAYTDPRSHIIIDDAKAHFASQHQKFDIIISEPSNPWISGVGSLFSKEFYQFVPRHLNDDGLFVQWVQLYEINEQLIGSILQALTPAFSDYAAWISNRTDLIIVARPKGKLPELDFGRLANAKPLLSELQELGISRVEQLAFRRVADDRLLRAFATAFDQYPANSDYLPLLGLYAPRTRFQGQAADTLIDLPFANTRLLEALGIRKPLDPAIGFPDFSNFFGDGVAEEARLLADDMRSDAPTTRVRATITKSLSTSACTFEKNDDARRLWAGQAQLLFDETVPFLPPPLLQGVWIAPSWQRCTSLEPAYAQLLALLERHARRDYHGMEQLGREWLERKQQPNADALYKNFDQVAFTGLLQALVRQARWDDIAPTIDRYEKSLQLGDESIQQIRLIAALAKDQKNPSSGK